MCERGAACCLNQRGGGFELLGLKACIGRCLTGSKTCGRAGTCPCPTALPRIRLRLAAPLQRSFIGAHLQQHRRSWLLDLDQHRRSGGQRQIRLHVEPGRTDRKPHHALRRAAHHLAAQLRTGGQRLKRWSRCLGSRHLAG